MPEELEEVREQLRKEVREAHGVLKDLHREIREARSLVPLLARELFEEEVKKQLTALGNETQKAMDAAVTRVDAKFMELFELYMRGSQRDRRAGRPSMAEMLKRHAAGRPAEPGRPDA